MQHLSLTNETDQSQQRRRRSPLLPLLLFLSLLIASISVLCVAQLVIQSLLPNARVFGVNMMAARNVNDLYSAWLDVPRIPAPLPDLVQAEEASPTIGTVGPFATVPVSVVDRSNQPTPTATPTRTATATARPASTPTPTRQPASPTSQPPSPTPQLEQTALAIAATERAIEATGQPQATAAPSPSATATPSPTRTATPVPPTNTPRPTNTVVPTVTPLPTGTATPLPPNTPVPTSTPRPAATPVPPTVQFAQNSFSVSEGIGTVLLTVRLSAAATTNTTVQFDTVDDTATAGADYVDTNGTLTFQPGETSQSIPLTIIDDTIDEEAEQFTIQLFSSNGAVLGGSAIATITITDDDGGAVVQFAEDASSFNESAGEATVRVRLDAISAFNVQVPYTVAGTATGADHRLEAGTLTIPAGSDNVFLRFGVINDALHETNETIIITLAEPTANGSLGAQNVHTLTIVDNDPAPIVNFELENQQVDEDVGTASFKVQLDAPSGLPTSITFTLAGDAAGGGADYRITRNSVEIAAGGREATVQVQINNDSLDELDETIEIRLDQVANGQIGGRNVHRLLIRDDDDPPTLVFETDESRIDEGAASLTRSIALQLVDRDGALQASELPVTVPFTVSGTATGLGVDYSLPPAVAAGVLTIAPGNETASIDVTVVNDALDENIETVIITLGTPQNARLGDPRGHTLDIVDDDAAPQVSFVQPNGIANESIGGVAVPIRLSAPSGRNVTVPFQVNGSATPGVDHSLASASVSFPAGAVTATIPVSIINDALDEHDETLSIQLQNSDTAVTASPDQFMLTIVDDDAAPTLSIDGAAMVDENDPTGTSTLTVRLSAASGRTVTVPVAVIGGTASGSGSFPDYVLSTATVTFNPGVTVVTRTITINNDAFYEADEDVIVELGAPLAPNQAPLDQPTAVLGPDVRHTLVINDDDARPTLRFSQPAFVVSEAATQVVIAVTLDGPTGLPVSVDYGTQPGTATSPADFNAASGRLLFAPPAPASPLRTQTFTVTLNPDRVDEGASEVFQAVLSNLQGADFNANPSQADVIIEDDDRAGFALINANGLVTTEDGGSAQFQIRLTSQPTADVTMTMLSSDLSEGQILSSPNLVFTPANWDQPQTVIIGGVDDDVDESNPPNPPNIPYEILFNPANSADPFYSGLVPPETVTIINQDNDSANIAVVPFDPLVGTTTDEDGGSFQLALRLFSQPFADVIVNLSVSDASEATISPSTVIFSPLNWNNPQYVTVSGLDDAIDDGDVPYSIMTAPAISADPVYSGMNAVDIGAVNNDNGDMAGLSLSVSDLVLNEDGSSADFTVQLTSEPVADVTVPVSSSDATEGTVSPASLVFTAANWDQPQTVTVTGVDDDSIDGDRSYIITVGPSSSADAKYNNLSSSIVNVINRDNDSAGLQITPASLTTSESGTAEDFAVVLTAEPASPVTLNFDTAPLGAEGAIDKTSLVFGPGNWDQPQTVTVTGQDDDVSDGDQTYEIRIGSITSSDANFAGLDIAALPFVTVTNLDDDVVGLQVTPLTGLVTDEDGSSADIEIRLDSQPTADVTVNVTVSDSSEGSVNPGSRVFTPGNWNQVQRVTITGADDAIDDGDVAYTVELTTVSTDPDYAGLSATVEVTNQDNDTSGVAINTLAAVPEGNSGTRVVTFTVSLSAESTRDIEVTYETVDGTATAGGSLPGANDYVPQTPGNLVIPAGADNAPLTVEIIGDTVFEDDEQFTVRLISASDGVDTLPIGVAEGSVGISNDDSSSFSFSAGSYTVNEGDSEATIEVELSNPVGRQVSIEYASVDGSAVDGDDYDAVSGTLTFDPGETSQSFTVPIRNDSVGEPLEELALQLSNVMPLDPALDIATPSAVLTIVDDEPRVAFSSPTYTVVENEPTAVITVTLDRIAPDPVTVDYRAYDLPGDPVLFARNGLDYNAVNDVLTFAPGETTKTFEITILDNLLGENDEDLGLELTNVSANAWPAAPEPMTAILTILDDEPRVRFSSATYNAVENAGVVTIFVELTSVLSDTVTVNYRTENGTATAGSDYGAVSGTLTFNPSDSTRTFTVSINDDTAGETPNPETVRLILENVSSNAWSGVQDEATLNINDNEPRISFVDPRLYPVAEDGASVTVNVELDRSYPQEVRVEYETQAIGGGGDPAATPGSDYVASSGTLIFPATQTSASFTVVISEDALDEPPERIRLRLFNPTGNAVVGNGQAFIRISDNDTAPNVSFAGATQTVGEGDGTVTLSAQLDTPSGYDVEVPFTLGGTAVNGADYTLAESSIIIPAGSTSGSVILTILDDNRDEEDEETVVATMGTPINATAAVPDTQTISIQDNDPAPVVEFIAASFDINEAASIASIRVRLAAVSDRTVQVDYSTADDQALAGSDYTTSSGTLTFDPGQTERIFTVPIINDNDSEGDETLRLILSNPNNAVITGIGEALLTILDND